MRCTATAGDSEFQGLWPAVSVGFLKPVLVFPACSQHVLWSRYTSTELFVTFWPWSSNAHGFLKSKQFYQWPNWNEALELIEM